MTSPLIGITAPHVSSHSSMPVAGVSEAYIRAVRSAGGTPVLIPPGLKGGELDTLRSRLDGLLFTGGGDIDPALFNGKPHPRVYDIDAERDDVELNLVRLAAKSDWPFLGICRGIQVINVALGGTLYTDILDQHPGAMRHDWYPDIPRSYLAHSVKLEPSSKLVGILGSTEVPTNSLHHQGVGKVAPILKSTAYAPDGVIEAVELENHRFGLGVQWHPEWLQEHESMRALFRALVKASQS